jgi:hypothetical protein
MKPILTAVLISELLESLNSKLESENFIFTFHGSLPVLNLNKLTFSGWPALSMKSLNECKRPQYSVYFDELNVLYCSSIGDFDKEAADEAGQELARLLGCEKYVEITQ